LQGGRFHCKTVIDKKALGIPVEELVAVRKKG
jgi:hypothetical protein